MGRGTPGRASDVSDASVRQSQLYERARGFAEGLRDVMDTCNAQQTESTRAASLSQRHPGTQRDNGCVLVHRAAAAASRVYVTVPRPSGGAAAAHLGRRSGLP